jgi:hypothetical protein
MALSTLLAHQKGMTAEEIAADDFFNGPHSYSTNSVASSGSFLLGDTGDSARIQGDIFNKLDEIGGFLLTTRTILSNIFNSLENVNVLLLDLLDIEKRELKIIEKQEDENLLELEDRLEAKRQAGKDPNEGRCCGFDDKESGGLLGGIAGMLGGSALLPLLVPALVVVVKAILLAMGLYALTKLSKTILDELDVTKKEGIPFAFDFGFSKWIADLLLGEDEKSKSKKDEDRSKPNKDEDRSKPNKDKIKDQVKKEKDKITKPIIDDDEHIPIATVDNPDEQQQSNMRGDLKTHAGIQSSETRGWNMKELVRVHKALTDQYRKTPKDHKKIRKAVLDAVRFPGANDGERGATGATGAEGISGEKITPKVDGVNGSSLASGGISSSPVTIIAPNITQGSSAPAQSSEGPDGPSFPMPMPSTNGSTTIARMEDMATSPIDYHMA